MWWNKWLIVGMVATAIAATLLAVAQVMVNKDSKLLSDSQDKLIKLKDTKLGEELSAKGLLIAEANARSDEANTKAESLRLAIATADARAANANRIAEEERLARIRIEEGLASRRLTNEQQVKLAEHLARFTGQTAAIWFNAGDMRHSFSLQT